MKTKRGYIDYFQLDNPLTKVKSVLSLKARTQIYGHFTSLVKPSAHDKVLDMGVTPDTLLVESNYFEKLYPYTDNITMSSIEDASNLEKQFPGTAFILNSGREFPFSDRQFDILFCSAVLEHVGTDAAQKIFIGECLRVAKKIYLTTPNKNFPVEFHTYLPILHYLPQAAHQRILRLLKMDFWADTANLNLLTGKKLFSLLPVNDRKNARLYYNRLFGLATNLILFVDNSGIHAIDNNQTETGRSIC